VGILVYLIRFSPWRVYSHLLVPLLVTALSEAGRLKRGDKVLVTAAAGGTGQFAVQLAKLAGCHVVATCGGDRKVAMLKSLGADRIIDYKTEKLKVRSDITAPNDRNFATHDL